MNEMQCQLLCQNDKSLGRKKLSLTPELKKLPIGSTNTKYYNSDFSNGFEYLKNSEISLEENMELISKNILIERKYFQDFVDNLESQVIQLEEENYSKSVKIENLQLYNSEKLKIINSLTTLLNESKWKYDMMQKFCEEHNPNKLYKVMLLVSYISDKVSVFKSKQEKLNSYLSNLEENGPQTLVVVVQQLKSGLDECISVMEKAISKELLDVLLNENDLNDTLKNVIYKLQKFQFDVPQQDYNSAIELIDLLKIAPNDKDNFENLIDFWEVMKNLFQRNQYLANRVSSLNIHKIGWQLQLDEMLSSIQELEFKTMTEIEEVEKKEEILNQNESMIQHYWDEMDTSQEIITQTQRAQEIDQELEDLQIEFHNHDRENRQLKTNLNHLKNELNEYQLKCEQLVAENKQIENEKNDILEAYAKSWGHHNAKQKIKYTGKLIKDVDSITQEIKSLELELEKYENNVNTNVKTPVFSKIQPKSEKTQRTFGVIDGNKQKNIGLFRESVVRSLRY